jgi:hypothetical protein
MTNKTEIKINENDIVETLPDGSTYVFNMDVCQEAADDALGMLWSKEGRTEKFDYTGAVFSLFTTCVHILSNSGWNTEELINEVIAYSESDDNVCDHCGEHIVLGEHTEEQVVEESKPVAKHLH